MRSFVDASVIVAILGDEIDAYEQAARVRDSVEPFTSPLAMWEAAAALARRNVCTPEQAMKDVEELMEVGGIQCVSIGQGEAALAIRAFALFGKGTGHPAQLNLGDCFAYACAKANDARLLYKGDDFAKTDLAAC
jgi:ribonuclease VapC